MKQFTQDDIVIIKNVDDEDFEFAIFGQSGYLIPAGEQEKMPGYMAGNCMKHLCDKIMQKRGEVLLLNNPDARAKVYEELFVDVEATIKPMPRNDAQRARSQFEEARSGVKPGDSNISTAGVEDALADNLINDLDAANAGGTQEESAFPGL